MKGVFIMAKYKVEITGINTKDLQTLTQEEMIELFKRYKENDQYAKELLVNGNLKLVLSILKKYVSKTDNLDDLFQIGCIGLLKAIDNFDLSHEVKFSTYAVPMILGEIRRYIRDNNSIRISRSLKDIAPVRLISPPLILTVPPVPIKENPSTVCLNVENFSISPSTVSNLADTSV